MVHVKYVPSMGRLGLLYVLIGDYMDTSTKIILGIGAALLVLIPTSNFITSVIVDAVIVAGLYFFIKSKF